MKKSIFFITACYFVLLSLNSCSEDEDVVTREEFLSAQINENNFNVSRQNGILRAEKQLSSYGTINLLVSGENYEGKSIEFLVLYYNGEKTYTIGNRPFLTPGSFLNTNWCKYSEHDSDELWSTINEFFYTGLLSNYVEITEDDGSYITGNFSFEGHNSAGSSSRLISDGNFRLKVKHAY
ncbi:hypothetical protein [Salinimicrobium sp. GXAS 041]|uniref:hypothetical protein n=1 Tax=Salinimicrobium sp. GXAS 041 TaxID=3400806 RepID=UPI003C759DC0